VTPFQDPNSVEEVFVLMRADRWALGDTLP
jgi:hypothetical protein